MRFRDATIRQKLTWMSAAASTIALLLAATAFFVYHLMTARGFLGVSLPIRASIIGLNSVSSLRFDDRRAAEETLSALRADPNIVAAAIYSAEGKLFAAHAGDTAGKASVPSAVPSNAPAVARFEGRTLEISHPIVADGERLGTVRLTYNLAELYADAARFGAIALLVLTVSVGAAVLAADRIQRGLSVPIARLGAAARAVSQQKDYNIRVEPTRSRDELGVLIDTFNEMLAQIQAREVEVEAATERYERLNESLEQQVQRRTQELESTNKELEAFTYSVSHDLRAPLRRIDGFANLLLDEYRSHLPEEAARYLTRVREGTRQMGELVDDLLNLARLGRKELQLQVTGLSTLVESVAASLKNEAGGRVIEWRIQPLPFVECDPALMDVVFTNLLSNAVKYTRPRGHAVIEVGSCDHNGRPVIFVRDNGVGFSMKYADKLFGVFQRLHRVEDFEGTGVGLATVQRIVNKHGGAVWAEAELDKGACFYFTLGTPAA